MLFTPKWYSPQFSAHVCYGKTAGWIKMPFGRKVRLGPGHIVLDRAQFPLPQKGAQPRNFGPMFIVAKGFLYEGRTTRAFSTTCTVSQKTSHV